MSADRGFKNFNEKFSSNYVAYPWCGYSQSRYPWVRYPLVWVPQIWVTLVWTPPVWVPLVWAPPVLAHPVWAAPVWATTVWSPLVWGSGYPLFQSGYPQSGSRFLSLPQIPEALWRQHITVTKVDFQITIGKYWTQILITRSAEAEAYPRSKILVHKP